MSHKINPFIIIDFETGGLKSKINPATEVAMLCLDGITLQEVGRYESYIQPYLYEYDQKTLDYTNITMEKLKNEGKPLQQVGNEMMENLKDWYSKTTNSYTKKPILVGHNVNFDIGFLQQIFKETKNDIRKYLDGNDDFFGNYLPSYLDTMSLSKMAFGDDDNFTSYKLTNCVVKAGLSITDAHKAMNDVIATKELFINFVNRMRSVNTQLEGQSGKKIRFRENYQFQM